MNEPLNLARDIAAYEADELDEDQIRDLFAALVRTGTIHHLQGEYQRTADEMILAGLIPPEDSNDGWVEARCSACGGSYEVYHSDLGTRELLDYVAGHGVSREDAEDYLLDRVLLAAYAPRPGEAPPRYELQGAQRALGNIAARMNRDGTRDLAWWIPGWASATPRVIATGLALGLASCSAHGGSYSGSQSGPHSGS